MLVGSCKAETDSPLTPWLESCLAQLLLLLSPRSLWPHHQKGHMGHRISSYPRACPCQGMSKGPYPAQGSGFHFLNYKGVPPICSMAPGPDRCCHTLTLAVVFLHEGTVSSPFSLGTKQQPLLPQQPLSPSLAFQILQDRRQQPSLDSSALPGVEAAT